MCLAVPGRVISIDGQAGRVEFGGVEREVQLDLVPGTCAGDYVLVHAGFAIQRLSPEEAQETIELLKEAESKMNQGGS